FPPRLWPLFCAPRPGRHLCAVGGPDRTLVVGRRPQPPATAGPATAERTFTRFADGHRLVRGVGAPAGARLASARPAALERGCGLGRRLGLRTQPGGPGRSSTHGTAARRRPGRRLADQRRLAAGQGSATARTLAQTPYRRGLLD